MRAPGRSNGWSPSFLLLLCCCSCRWPEIRLSLNNEQPHRQGRQSAKQRLHKEVWETSKHQRVHKSLRWDEGASAGWTTSSMSEKLILHLDWSQICPAKPFISGSDHHQETCGALWILYRLSILCVCATSWGYLQFTLVVMMLLHTSDRKQDR